MTDAQRRVLNTLLHNTNDVQGEWTSKRSLFTTLVANGGLSPDEVATALTELVNAGDQTLAFEPAAARSIDVE